MWILYAFGSALFAGLTAVLAKCGIRKTDSTVATAIRTIVVLAFSWLMVFIVGSQERLSAISEKTLLFLILSGLATGASWLCYFRALQIGDINKVVPVDKSSTARSRTRRFPRRLQSRLASSWTSGRLFWTSRSSRSAFTPSSASSAMRSTQNSKSRSRKPKCA